MADQEQQNAHEDQELIREVNELVESAKDLPSIEGMDIDFDEELLEDKVVKRAEESKNIENNNQSKSTEVAKVEKIVVKLDRNRTIQKRPRRNFHNHRPFYGGFFPPPPQFFPRLIACVLCQKQGIRKNIFHLQRDCPFLRVCVNKKGEKLCFTCKSEGHLAKDCPKNN